MTKFIDPDAIPVMSGLNGHHELGDKPDIQRVASSQPAHIRALEDRLILPYMDKFNLEEKPIIEYVDKYTGKASSCAEAGEMMAFYGPPKSRKTTAMYGLAASAFTDNEDYTLGFRINDFTPGEDSMIFLDTEQSLKRTYMRQRAFFNMVGHKATDTNKAVEVLKEMGYYCYNIRPYTPDERIDQIQYLFETYSPKLLFIDQIGDLAWGYNDDKSVQELMNIIDVLCEEHETVIVTDIHTNRGRVEAMGKLGSYLDKKVVTALLLEYDDDSKTTVVKSKYTREAPIPEFSFAHNWDGTTVLMDVKSEFGGDFFDGSYDAPTEMPGMPIIGEIKTPTFEEFKAKVKANIDFSNNSDDEAEEVVDQADDSEQESEEEKDLFLAEIINITSESEDSNESGEDDEWNPDLTDLEIDGYFS